MLALLQCKCPQCQSGKVFLHPAWKLNKFTEMESHCPVCDVQFEIEPGFFWGAMYISYAMTVAMMLIIGGSILLLSHGHAGFWTYIIPIVGTLVLSAPFTYRYARILLLYFVSPIRFNPSLANKSKG
jgi:hypothetical protein